MSPRSRRSRDVLCIARPSKVKRMTDLLGAARAVFDQGHRVKVLMLCARPRDISDGDVWDHEFLNAWQEGFTASEKDDLELVLPVDDGTMFPYGALDIARLYRASRSFLLCSQREGSRASFTKRCSPEHPSSPAGTSSVGDWTIWMTPTVSCMGRSRSWPV